MYCIGPKRPSSGPPLHCEKYLAKESAERKWIFQGVCVGGNGDLRPTSSGHDQIYRPFQCAEKLAFPICFYQYADFLSSPLKHHLSLGALDIVEKEVGWDYGVYDLHY